VKVGSSGRDAVDDEVASLAALDTEELASLRTDCASALTVPASKAAAEMAAVAEKRILTQLQRIDQSDQVNWTGGRVDLFRRLGRRLLLPELEGWNGRNQKGIIVGG
jgi:hypothetical protein